MKNARIALSPISRLKQGELNNVYSLQIMRKVWKIGTRWGDYGPSNLDLFFNYGCAFFNVDGSRIGDYTRAQPGDLLLVCDRSRPVAIAQMTSAFTDYAESGINFCELDKKEWVDPYSIVICKVRFHMIPNGEMVDWHNDSRKRFCSHSTGEIVNEKWEQYENAAARGAFDIKCRTVSFLASDTESGVFSPLIRYRVPVYQRPYSWGEQELRRLMEDLREAVRNTEPVFLGTMQLSAPIPLGEAGCAYDIIDGQQRTTTLMLLRCLLEEKLGRLKTDDGRERLYITHVNRGAAQRELDEFWNAWRKGELTSCSSDKNPYLSNIACLNNLLDEYFFSKEEDGSSISPEKLLDFLETNLRFVVIETHAGLSKTLRIFNTINTTGLDLGADDLFKIRFYEYRKDVVRDSDDVFDSISGVYERVSEARKKAVGGFTFSMSDVLDVYKRVLIAKYKMKSDLDRFATPRFFESLFDSLLNVRRWPEFKDVDVELKVEDLDGIVDAFEIMSKAFKENDHLYVMHHFLLETRYGFVWNYLAVALFFRSITPDEVLEFETHLFKLLVPPSLRWAKMVYSVQSELWKILHALPDNEGKGVDLLGTLLRWVTKNAHHMGYTRGYPLVA